MADLEPDKQELAKAKADKLHDLEEQEKAVASSLPDGAEKDRHQMTGERLSDEAWHIEEENDLDPRPSGLWPEPK